MSIAECIKGFIHPTTDAEKLLAAQAAFLLSQAPLLNLPDDMPRLGRTGSKFAYVNPATFSKVTRVPVPYGARDGSIPPSLTRWVFVSILPKGTVIFSPNAMPGLSNE